MRSDAMRRDRVEEERVTVRVRFGDGRGGDGAAGAAPIADDHRLSERVRKPGADDAGDEIRSAPRRHCDHQPNRPVGIVALRTPRRN